MRPTERDESVAMISRVSTILRLFQGDERSFSISEIARRTAIPKASTARIVTDLIAERFLEKDGQKIQLGIRLFELGQHASRPTDLRKFTLPTMTELMKATGQTVHLAVLEGTEVVYVQILRSRLTPPLPSRVGGRLPAYATGVGKVLLAYASESIVDEVCSSPLTPVGPDTITDPNRLRAELAAIRANRIAFERQESTPNVGCAAAPIINGEGAAIASLSVSVHLHQTDLSKMGPAVATAAMALSREAARRRFLLH
jgi:IclR family acetate operon transcriptional repressor